MVFMKPLHHIGSDNSKMPKSGRLHALNIRGYMEQVTFSSVSFGRSWG